MPSNKSRTKFFVNLVYDVGRISHIYILNTSFIIKYRCNYGDNSNGAISIIINKKSKLIYEGFAI